MKNDDFYAIGSAPYYMSWIFHAISGVAAVLHESRGKVSLLSAA